MVGKVTLMLLTGMAGGFFLKKLYLCKFDRHPQFQSTRLLLILSDEKFYFRTLPLS